MSWESIGTPLETALPFEFVNTELTILPFPLQHTKGPQATGKMMQVARFGACFTASQTELILTGVDYFLDVGADAIHPSHLGGQLRQAIGGIVLLAVSDNQHFEAPTQPAGVRPIRTAPITPKGLTIEPEILFQAIHEVPPVVPKALKQRFGRVPGVEDNILRTTVQTVAGIAQ